MSVTHHMHLNTGDFKKIENGDKEIEVRLLDEKRSKVKVGDRVVFKDRDREQRILTEVVELLKYESFRELFQSENLSRFGKESNSDIEDIVQSIRKFYSKEDESSYGVVGIVIKVLEK